MPPVWEQRTRTAPIQSPREAGEDKMPGDLGFWLHYAVLVAAQTQCFGVS